MLYLQKVLYKIEKTYCLDEKEGGRGLISRTKGLIVSWLNVCQWICSDEMTREQICISSQPGQTAWKAEVGKVSIQNEIVPSSPSDRELREEGTEIKWCQSWPNMFNYVANKNQLKNKWFQKTS